MTTQPEPRGASIAEKARHENSMPSATPARSALARAARMAPASRSEARINGLAGRTSFAASSNRTSHSFASKPGHSMKAKRRARPGAKRRANSAASMGIVPEPQKGSSSGAPASQPEASTIAQAKVSLKGAFAVARR